MLSPADALVQLIQLHDGIDHEAGRLTQIHAERLVCRRGCCQCCLDDLTVFEIEAARIREQFPELLATGVPHAAGACAFLDEEGACRIYAARPYVCRTQGLPLRWIDDDLDGDVVELRDLCPLNDPPDAEPLEELPTEHLWTLGPVEEQLSGLQRASGEALKRIPLRSLFTATEKPD